MIDLKKLSLLIFCISNAYAYMVDGTLDRSYAMGQQMNEQLPVCKAVVMQGDKMLIAGYVETHGKKTFTVARVLQNGMLDESFGNNGKVQTNFSNAETASSAQAIMIDSQGRIVAGGFTNGINNVCHACLARYNADGSLDKSFFGGRGIFKGTVITTFGSPDQPSHISALAETKDLNIVAVGSAQENKQVRFAVAQYKPSGALDINFNAGRGMVCTQFDSSPHDEAFAVTIDSHDKIVVAGSSYASGIKTFALARYHKDGSLDQSFFGGNTRMHGIVVTNFMGGETEGQARAVCMQDDGKIIAAGYTNALCANSTQFALVRYTAQGMLDQNFKGDDSAAIRGTIVTHFGDARTKSAINALLMQPDGKIVAGGFAQINNEKYFALARYENDGACDYTFNGGGAPQGMVLSRSTSQSSDEIFGMAFALPGDIVAAGSCKSNISSCGAIARYLCDQDLDCPMIEMPYNEQVIINGSAIKVKGTCQKTGRLQIYVDDKMVDAFHARGANHWECTLPPLASGYHCLRICERYDAGNIILNSGVVRILVDQHPLAVNQTIECHGARNIKGSLAARGASGEYSFKLLNEKNCHVSLMDAGAYSCEVTIPAGDASFDFEVKDNITGCSSKGSISVIVREIPLANSVSLEMPQDNKLNGNLEAFITGGQKPYVFNLMGGYPQCILQPEGTFSFQPEPEFTGITNFQFTATDKYNVSSEPGQVNIQVHPVPRAYKYTMNGFFDADNAGCVNQCASDGCAPYTFYANQFQEQCSVIMQSNGSFICRPLQGCPENISFEYMITDGRGYSSKPCQVTLCLYKPLKIEQTLFIGFQNSDINNNLNILATKGSAPYIFELEQQSADGRAIVHPNGSFEFRPQEGFAGLTFFTVRIHNPNVPAELTQIVKIELLIKLMSDFETTPVHLYQDMQTGDLKKVIQCCTASKFKLVHAPKGVAINLHEDGLFSFAPSEGYNEKIEFIYGLLDESGKETGLKHAQVILHKYPVAYSVAKEVEVGQIISGNLNELMPEGIAPFSYKIVSASNGKIVCQPDGSYTFKPRFDLADKAEFSYIATDVNNHTTNLAHVKFHWLANH